MGIGMPDLFDPEKGALLFQQFDYALIGLEHKLSFKLRYESREFSVIIDGCIDIEAVFQSRFIVIFTMTGRDMDNTASFSNGYEIAGDNS